MIPLAKNIKRYFSLKELAIVIVATVVAVSVGVGVFVNLKREVVINDNGSVITVKTMKTTVSEVLEQNAVKLEPYDYINLKLSARLQKLKKTEIYIKRAVPVNVYADGQRERIMTYRDTVREVLADCSISLSGKDRLDEVGMDDPIARDMDIRVVRVKEEVVSEQLPVPFRTVSKENNRLDKGSERTAKEGKEGIREKLFKVVIEDGREISRELLKDSIIQNPVDKVVEFGTVLNYKTSRGEVLRYRKVYDMRATAYTASVEDTGKGPGDPGFGITYTGMRVRKGVIAVDPRKIPLGSRVYVEVLGRTPDYGYAVAADIGGAIKGDLIDLYFDDSKTVDNWGCKKVRVYMLVD